MSDPCDCVVSASAVHLRLDPVGQRAHPGRDRIGGLFEHEMTAVEQLHRRVRIVALERVRAGRREERIVLAPHHEHRRLVRAQILLPLREPLRIGAVVVEELELNRVVAGTVEQRLIERLGIGRDPLRPAGAVRVLEDGRFARQPPAHRGFVRRAAILPVGHERRERFGDAVEMRNRVLHDDRSDELGTCRREAEADRSAVILHVERGLRDAQRVDELPDDLCQVVEGVGELLRRGCVAETETRIVRRDEPEAVGQLRHQVLEHVRRCRPAVQQQDDQGRPAGRLRGRKWWCHR